MRTMVPVYYPDFRCAASSCRHTCCAGWEIGVDSASLARYRSYAGPLGGELRAAIADDGEGGAVFRLREDGRCPFLAESGLCRIITEMGEDALCEICAMHPRWVNEFSCFTEMGLGLTCEEAARIILGEKRKAVMIPLEDDGGAGEMTEDEKAFFGYRERVLGILWDRGMLVTDRLTALEKTGLAVPTGDAALWRDRILKLECMDPEWRKAAAGLVPGAGAPSGTDLKLEQAAVYFVMRHLSPAVGDGMVRERCGLAVLLARLLAALSRERDMEDTARMMSTEIEYSDMNVPMLLEMIAQQ